jgi:hypothetical protein
MAYGEEGPLETGRFLDGASPYGVLNMAGNAAEWTATPVPLGREEFGDNRIKVMGGSFADAGAEGLRTSSFRGIERKSASREIGFRCAKFYLPPCEPSTPRTPAMPPAVYLSEDYRVSGNEEIRGKVRLLVRNSTTRAIGLWNDGWFPYLTRVMSVADGNGAPLPFTDELPPLPEKRRISVKFDPPLGPGEARVLRFEISSRLFGMPRFLRNVDRFHIEHVPTVPPGRGYQLRILLPSDVLIEGIEPEPDSANPTAAGLELFWKIGEFPRRSPGVPALGFSVRYRREGVDQRFEERDQFVEDRARLETGLRDFDARKELRRYSKHYHTSLRVNREQMAQVFAARAGTISRVDSSLDIRAVEIFGDVAHSVESMSTKIWDRSGKMLADMREVFVRVVCIREEGEWKHLTEESFTRYSPGVIDEETNTYEHKRFKCRLGPVPGWRMWIQKAIDGISLGLNNRDDTTVNAAFTVAPAAESNDLDKMLETHIESLRTLVNVVEIGEPFAADMGGVPGRGVGYIFFADRGGIRTYGHQRHMMAMKNRCVYIFVETSVGTSLDEVRRKRDASRPRFDELLAALVID